MVLLHGSEGPKKAEENREKILKFLGKHTWSHSSVLQDLLGLKTYSSTNRILKKLEAQKLVKRHKVEILGSREITVWGITPRGVELSYSEDDWEKEKKPFQFSKLKLSRIPHTLGLQQLEVHLLSQGWSRFQHSRPLKNKNLVPDAVAVNPEGKTCAIEVERTVKSKARYRKILVHHLAEAKAGKWDEIWYFCPEKLKNRLENAFFSLEWAVYGEKFKIKEGHLRPFKFVGLKFLK